MRETDKKRKKEIKQINWNLMMVEADEQILPIKLNWLKV